MHVYQMRSSNQNIVTATQARLSTCMTALKDVSKVWLVAKMVHTLFESILGNKALEERLQKAAGRKHNKNKHNHASSQKPSIDTPSIDPSDHKRKFDDMEMGYSNGPPAPQMSYERSRPQSPAMSPSQAFPTGSQPSEMPPLPNMTASSPVIRHNNDAFMGRSRPHTRPTTPFNGFSYPGTPPDFFLHTRGSPKIHEDVWQNYQPDQLFPPETNQLFPVLSNSPSQQMNVDPSLRSQFSPSQGAPNLQSPHNIHSMPNMNDTMPPQHNSMNYPNDPAAWAQFNAQNGSRPTDDQWSNSSSAGGPIVPTTLNVGDWFEFFGIQNAADIQGLNGLNGMNGGAPQQQQGGFG